MLCQIINKILQINEDMSQYSNLILKQTVTGLGLDVERPIDHAIGPAPHKGENTLQICNQDMYRSTEALDGTMQ
jgi:hypothetical protein